MRGRGDEFNIIKSFSNKSLRRHLLNITSGHNWFSVNKKKSLAILWLRFPDFTDLISLGSFMIVGNVLQRLFWSRGGGETISRRFLGYLKDSKRPLWADVIILFSCFREYQMNVNETECLWCITLLNRHN